MIYESWPWKQELRRLLRTIRAEARRLTLDDESDQAGFKLERAIFYASFAIRKLIENGKITDKVARQVVGVTAFKANAAHQFSMMDAFTAGFDEDEYALDEPEKLTFLAADLASEIIHSHRLVWSFGESGFVEGIFVASYRNGQKRILLVPLDTIGGVIETIANDLATFIRMKVMDYPTKSKRPLIKRTVE